MCIIRLLKERSRFVAIVIIVLFSVSAIAATGKGDGRDADHKALQLLGEQAAKALNEQDFKLMESCFSKNFVFIPIDQRVITSVEQFRKYYKEIKTDNNYGVTGMTITPAYDIPTVFTGSDTGYCYGTADNTFILKGRNAVHVKSRWSASFIKEDGKWKIAMVQSGVNFLDNPMLLAVRGAAELQMKVTGVVIVLMIFLVLYLVLQRRKKSEKQEEAVNE